jgi:DNA-binding GntR family transcriptional regulator
MSSTELVRAAPDQSSEPAAVAKIRAAIVSSEFVANQRWVEVDLSEPFSASRGSLPQSSCSN